MRSSSIAGSIAAAILAIACSNSTAPVGGPPDAAHFASAMAASFCGALGSCCGAAKLAYDSASCVAQLQARFQTEVDVVKRGRVLYDANAVPACEEALKKREAACSEDAASPGTTPSGVDAVEVACWPVLTGIVDPGGGCASAAECRAAGPNVLRTCTADTRPGAPSPSATVCFTNTTRVPPGGACRGQVVAGGFETATCDAALGYCEVAQPSSSDPTAGTCVAYAKLGENCVGTDPQHTPRCEPTTSVCDFANTRTCLPLPSIGQPCDGFGVYACAAGAYCDRTGGGGTGTCAAVKRVGDACQVNIECASGSCQFAIVDGGVARSTCAAPATTTHDEFDVSPRTCGFGPFGDGPDDAGIVARASARGVGAWYRVR